MLDAKRRMNVRVVTQLWAVALCLLLVVLPATVFSKDTSQAMTPFQAFIFNLFFPYDSSKLDPATFIPEPLNFFKLENAYFGIDCVFATFSRPEDTPVPPDLLEELRAPSRANALWKNGKPWRAFEYTAFTPGPVPDDITLGMSKETWTYLGGPSCSDVTPQSIQNFWFDSSARPDWFYSFGRKGEFMILVDESLDRAMVAFTD